MIYEDPGHVSAWPAFDNLEDTGGVGVRNFGKPDDVILERSLRPISGSLNENKDC